MQAVFSFIMSLIMGLISIIGGIFGFTNGNEVKMTKEEAVAAYNEALAEYGDATLTRSIKYSVPEATSQLLQLAFGKPFNDFAAEKLNTKLNIKFSSANFAKKFSVTEDMVDDYKAYKVKGEDNLYIDFTLNYDIVGRVLNPEYVENFGKIFGQFINITDFTYSEKDSSITVSVVLDSDSKLTNFAACCDATYKFAYKDLVKTSITSTEMFELVAA